MSRFIFALVILSIVLCDRQKGTLQNCLSPSWWNGRRCQCPANMINVNGRCVCDYGFLWKDGICTRCESVDVVGALSCRVTQETSCQYGTVFDKSYCLHNWNSTYCEKGSYWNGLYCTKYVLPIVCEAGYRWNGVTCVLSLVSKCPKNYLWNGKFCQLFAIPVICSTNFKWNALAEGCVSTTIDTCSIESIWNGAACVLKQPTIKCQAGTYFDGQLCISVGLTFSAICATGFNWNGRSCVVSRQCEQKYYLDTLTSCCLMFLCPKDHVFDYSAFSCRSTLQRAVNIPHSPSSSSSAGGIAIANSGQVSIARPGEIVYDGVKLRSQTTTQTNQANIETESISKGSSQASPMEKTFREMKTPSQPETIQTTPTMVVSQTKKPTVFVGAPGQTIAGYSRMGQLKSLSIPGNSFSIGNGQAVGGDAITFSGNTATIARGTASDSSFSVPRYTVSRVMEGDDVGSFMDLAKQIQRMQLSQFMDEQTDSFGNTP